MSPYNAELNFFSKAKDRNSSAEKSTPNPRPITTTTLQSINSHLVRNPNSVQNKTLDQHIILILYPTKNVVANLCFLTLFAPARAVFPRAFEPLVAEKNQIAKSLVVVATCTIA